MIDRFRETVDEHGVRRLLQSLVVVAFLVFVLGIVGMWRLLAFVGTVWFENFLGLVDAEKFAIHRIHDLSFALIFWAMVLGMAAQLRSPRRNLGGQLMAIVPLVALLVAIAITGVWDVLQMIVILGTFVGVATLLHPAGLDLLRWPDVSRVSKVLLALVVVAALPVLLFSAGQIDLQTADHSQHDHAEGGADAAEHDEHVEAGHFMLQAAFGFLVLGVGVLASLRPPGWWLPAGYTGVAASLFGIASVVYPTHASSAGGVWGVAALAWGLAFLAASGRQRRSDAPSPYGTPGADAAARE